MSEQQQQQQTMKAVVVSRSSQGGGMYVWPRRVYLALVPVGEDGEPVIPARMTQAAHYTWVCDNERATRRFRMLENRFDELAAAVNAKKMTFAQAQAAIHAEY